MTETGQVIRISDGAVVNGVAAPAAALAPATALPAASPYPSRPEPIAAPAPSPSPIPSPPRAPAAARPAPAFTPRKLPLRPAPVGTPTRDLIRRHAPRLATKPPVPSPSASLGRRSAAGTAPPPLPTSSFDDELPGDTTVTDRPPTPAEPLRVKPLPRLTGRLRIPPRPPSEVTTTTVTPYDELTDLSGPIDDATVVDDNPRESAPLPRLSARLAARRKSAI